VAEQGVAGVCCRCGGFNWVQLRVFTLQTLRISFKMLSCGLQTHLFPKKLNHDGNSLKTNHWSKTRQEIFWHLKRPLSRLTDLESPTRGPRDEWKHVHRHGCDVTGTRPHTGPTSLTLRNRVLVLHNRDVSAHVTVTRPRVRNRIPVLDERLWLIGNYRWRLIGGRGLGSRRGQGCNEVCETAHFSDLTTPCDDVMIFILMIIMTAVFSDYIMILLMVAQF
jgi:hypothetical protein